MTFGREELLYVEGKREGMRRCPLHAGSGRVGRRREARRGQVQEGAQCSLLRHCPVLGCGEQTPSWPGGGGAAGGDTRARVLRSFGDNYTNEWRNRSIIGSQPDGLCRWGGRSAAECCAVWEGVWIPKCPFDGADLPSCRQIGDNLPSIVPRPGTIAVRSTVKRRMAVE